MKHLIAALVIIALLAPGCAMFGESGEDMLANRMSLFTQTVERFGILYAGQRWSAQQLEAENEGDEEKVEMYGQLLSMLVPYQALLEAEEETATGTIIGVEREGE